MGPRFVLPGLGNGRRRRPVVSPGDAHGHDADGGCGRRRGRVRREARATLDRPMTQWKMPETQYAQSGDLSIAYQVRGDGPIDVVFISGFISHQELEWELGDAPIHRVLSYARLISFDKRGTGLSERTLGYGGAEDRMDDIRAVMDAAGSERAALIGRSE